MGEPQRKSGIVWFFTAIILIFCMGLVPLQNVLFQSDVNFGGFSGTNINALSASNYVFNGPNASLPGYIWSNNPVTHQAVLVPSPTGGGGSQTPWLQPIDGNSFSLFNVLSFNGVTQPFFIAMDGTGSDSNDGMSPETPWADIPYADIHATPGSTRYLIGNIRFTNGLNNTSFFLTNGGTYAGYGTPAWIYSTNTNVIGVITLASNNIILSNLVVAPSPKFLTNSISSAFCGAGIFIGTGGGKGVTNDCIVNCVVSNCTFGMLTIATNGSGGTLGIQVISNRFTHNAAVGLEGNCTTQPPSTYLNTNWYVANNIFDNNQGLPGQQFGIGFALLSMTGLTLTGNLCESNGLVFANSGGGSGGGDIVFTTKSAIVGNTFAFNGNIPGGNDQFGFDVDMFCTNNLIADNTCYGNGGPGFMSFEAWGGNTWLRNLLYNDAVNYIFGVSELQFGSEFDLDPGDDEIQLTNTAICSNIVVAEFPRIAPIFYAGSDTHGPATNSGNIFVTYQSNGFAIASVIVWDDASRSTKWIGNDYWSQGGLISWFYNFESYSTLSSWGQDASGLTQNPNNPNIWAFWPNLPQWQQMFNQTMNLWIPSSGITAVPFQNLLVGGGSGNSSMTGTNNLFVSQGSGSLNTTGSFNVAAGPSSLFNNKTGSENSVFGVNAGFSNNGSFNTFVGADAAVDNFDGSLDTAIGTFALLFGIHSSNNFAGGFNSQVQGISNQFTTSVGEGSAQAGTNLVHVTAIGDNTVSQLQKGSNIVGLGASAGSSLHTGWDDIYIDNIGNDGDMGVIDIGTDQTIARFPPNSLLSASNFIGSGATFSSTTNTGTLSAPFLGTDSNGKFIAPSVFPATILTNVPGTNRFYDNIGRLQVDTNLTLPYLAGPAVLTLAAPNSTVAIAFTGSNGQFLNGAGAFSTPSASGTVSSVTFTGDGVVDSSTPSSAVTTTGTVTATIKNQNANTVFAGPATGGAAAPTFQTTPTFNGTNIQGVVTTNGAQLNYEPIFSGTGVNGVTWVPATNVTIMTTGTRTNFVASQIYTNNTGSLIWLVGSTSNGVGGVVAVGANTFTVSVSNTGYASWTNYPTGGSVVATSVAGMFSTNGFAVPVDTNGVYMMASTATGTGNVSGLIPGTGQIITTGNSTTVTTPPVATVGNAGFWFPGGAIYVQGNITTAGPASANVVYITQMSPVQYPTTFSKVTINIPTLGAGGHYSIGICQTNGTKIFDTGPQSTAATGAFTTTLTNAAGFGAVWYPTNGPPLITFTCDNTTAKFSTIPGVAIGTTIINNSGSIMVGTSGNASVSGQSPATLGTLTGATVSAVPDLYFQ